MPFYAVAIGRTPGIYHSWDECQSQTNGFRNSKFHKFNSEEQAKDYIQKNSPKSSLDSGSSSSSCSSSSSSSSCSSNGDTSSDSTTSSRQTMAFYAVAIGNAPGIYHTWEECRKATEDFPSPKFRKFYIQKEAENFMNAYSIKTSGTDCGGQIIDWNSKPAAFYAVAIGHKRGIYETWKECQQQVDNFVGPVYRKFGTRQEAEKFIENNSPSKRKELPSFRGESFNKRGKRSDLEITSDGSIVAYTDGACVNNGKKHCAAGIGVFWADNHQDNISRPLDGRPTNNRAEIHAAITAIRQAKQNGHKRIIVRTDSKFLIDSATKWITGWKKNGWKLSTGEPVINKQDFLELIDVIDGMERVTWEKVAAHRGIYGNEMADRLARDGVLRPVSSKKNSSHPR